MGREGGEGNELGLRREMGSAEDPKRKRENWVGLVGLSLA